MATAPRRMGAISGTRRDVRRQRGRRQRLALLLQPLFRHA